MPEEKPIRPRFIIQKRKISGEEIAEEKKEEFIPEKVIYIELDDEITVVFDRIKRLRNKKIALVIPKRAIILQSIVNLKILKKKIDEIEKEIIIITSDLPGMQLAEKAGIPTAEKLFNKQENAFREQPAQQPIQTQRPTRMAGGKVSISEVIRKEKTAFLSSFVKRIKERFKKKKPLTGKETHLVFVTPNKQALFTLILVSVLLLLAIAYIALPGATIYLTPRSTVLDPSFNVTFLDYEKNRGFFENEMSNNIVIPSYPVAPPPFTKKFTHNATGKHFKGENARGIITVTNLSNLPWDLAAKTRFQTDDGFVFRTPVALRIPPAKGITPGILDVSVIADEFDVDGQVVGSRGNIGPSKFFLPGLKNEENRKKLFGENKTAMSGGTTIITKTVSKEDIEAAKQMAKREMEKSAPQDLKKFLEQQNLINKTNLSILTDRNLVKISDYAIDAPENLIGEIADQFEVTAVYSVRGTAFDRQNFTDALKSRIYNRADPDKKIIKIDEEDVSYKFLDEDAGSGKIRLTATMRAIQVYELDPEQENGHRFIKKITDHILGMRVKDAIAYLQQQTDEIARVEITTWPVWAPTIPNIADNIKFVVKEEETN